MSLAPPDSWIESRRDGALATDDAGDCNVCGQSIDSGACTCTDEEREDGPQGCTCPIGAEHCTC